MLRRTVLAAGVILGLAACGPAQAPTPPEAPPPVETSTAPTAPAAADPAVKAKIAALPAPYNQGDYVNGARVFAQCRACHLTEAGAGNRVGPNLHGVIGRKAGSAADFAYSDAMKSSGVTWDLAGIDKWIDKPTTFIPNNRMSFVGVHDPDNRRDVIAYLAVETTR